MNYQIRSATPDDHDLHICTQEDRISPSLCVEKNDGWDEAFQREDFETLSPVPSSNSMSLRLTILLRLYAYFFEDAYLVIAESTCPRPARQKGVGSIFYASPETLQSIRTKKSG